MALAGANRHPAWMHVRTAVLALVVAATVGLTGIAAAPAPATAVV
jgi:hypothetical protein